VRFKGSSPGPKPCEAFFQARRKQIPDGNDQNLRITNSSNPKCADFGIIFAQRAAGDFVSPLRRIALESIYA